MANRLLAQVDLDTIFQGQAAQAVTGANQGPTALINAILPNIYVIASLVLFAYLVFGGFLVLSSAGAEQTDKGKTAIGNAIMGYLIIFASYWLIQLVEIITGIPILSLPIPSSLNI